VLDSTPCVWRGVELAASCELGHRELFSPWSMTGLPCMAWGMGSRGHLPVQRHRIRTFSSSPIFHFHFFPATCRVLMCALYQALSFHMCARCGYFVSMHDELHV
jgi:hypothetical protein